MSTKARRDPAGPAHPPKAVEWVAISSLKTNKNNARTHSQRQVRQIAHSIERFGFLNPVLIDKDRQIICGHGRIAGARLNGLADVPTLTIEGLSDVELRAYVIADNRLAEKAGWDRETLAIELQGLIDLEFEVELTGFETAEIDILLDEVTVGGHAEDQEDLVPEPLPGAPVCRKGDLWLLGEHRLVCADAGDADAYRLLMGGQKAQFVFTDPPYNVPIAGHVSGLGRVRHREFQMASGEMTAAQFTAFLERVFQKLVANSDDGSIHQVCIDWRHLREMLDAGERVYTELKNLCVWNKTNAGMGSFYRSKHELIFVWKNGKAPHINNFELGQFGRSRANVWDYAGANSFSSQRMEDLTLHPTVKPVAMVADAVKDCSRRGGLVLDPFVGSGTLCIACENTGRKARAIEIDPVYCDVTIRRWQARTGKQAVRGGTDLTFETLEDQLQQGGTRHEEKAKRQNTKKR